MADGAQMSDGNRSMLIETPAWASAPLESASAQPRRPRILIFIVLGLFIVVGTVLLILPQSDDERTDTAPESNRNAVFPALPRNLIEGTTNRFSPSATNRATETPADAPAAPSFDSDYDRDGVPDRIEQRRGTNLNDADTDDDGLTDLDELYLYRSDPTDVDTDGDGYEDGEEIRHGYDPNGPGRRGIP